MYELIIKGGQHRKKYWQLIAQSQNTQINPLLIDLLSHMLDFDEKSRYSIDQVMKHYWMTGKTWSQSEVIKFME